MKRFYISVLTLLGLSLLIGCTDKQVEKDTKQLTKIEEIEVSEPLNIGRNADYSVPFKISEIKSIFVNLNDSASETPLRGVRYEVSLASEKEILNEDRSSFNFEVVTESTIMKESLGTIQPMSLTDTRDGYLYTLSFETIYREYSKEELEELIKERNFQIYLNYKGISNSIEFL
ncbi:hypothetical protein [Psychrobacillus sp. FJAT-51614]